MDKKDATELIEAIIDSIEREPGQFHIHISVTGQKISSSGGIGAIISATGGGPGSTTIGQSVSMNGAQIEFQRLSAIQGIEEQKKALVNALSNISVELNHPTPDKSKITNILNSLKETWVPPLIVSIVTQLVTKSIGL